MASSNARKYICGVLNKQNISIFRHEFSKLLLSTRSPLQCMYPVASYSMSLSNERVAVEEQVPLISQLTLKIRGSDEAVLDSYTQFMQRAAGVLNLDVSKRIVLPFHIEKRTLLKSPHIYKKHRVQYELRTHARMLQMKELTGDTADIYLEYVQRNIPEGVSMSVEHIVLEPIPEYIAPPSS